MKSKLYDNADSFAMSFAEEWDNIKCEDLLLKIDRVLELLERITSEPSTNVYGDDDWATPSE